VFTDTNILFHKIMSFQNSRFLTVLSPVTQFRNLKLQKQGYEILKAEASKVVRCKVVKSKRQIRKRSVDKGRKTVWIEERMRT
jgi:putative IMPACT (imprinted ancient) family translation regulator